MMYDEIEYDLFNLKCYAFAQCISADFILNEGIAKEFNKRFNLRYQLRMHYPNYQKRFADNPEMCSCCLYMRNTLNLVIKEQYNDKPTYKSIKRALIDMSVVCKERNIKFLAMPKIECDLDWDKVSKLIKTVFEDMDITIMVCEL